MEETVKSEKEWIREKWQLELYTTILHLGFMHLTDTFKQSDLQCNWTAVYRSNTSQLGIASTILYLY